MKYRRKKKNQRSFVDLFKEIWSEREHVCFNCAGYLGETARTWMFSHRIKKSQCFGDKSHLKYSKDNIDLACFKCHQAHETKNTKLLAERKDINRNRNAEFLTHF